MLSCFKFLSTALILSAFFTKGFTTTAQVRATSVAFVDPRPGGGTLLDDAGDGLGEPLNVSVVLYVHRMTNVDLS